jgi:hypothetical protein
MTETAAFLQVIKGGNDDGVTTLAADGPLSYGSASQTP